MAKFRFDRSASVVVTIAAVATVLTGEVSSVSNQAQEKAEAAVNDHVAELKKKLTTVSVVVLPPLQDHAVCIRISGVPEADKPVALATHAGGIITDLPAKQVDRVKPGDLILSIDAEKEKAMVTTAEQNLSQRKAERKRQSGSPCTAIC
jgi:multidrug efflux pump subunit AcrA (membrane-fusion protein)